MVLGSFLYNGTKFKKKKTGYDLYSYVSIALQLTFVDVLMIGIRHMLIIILSAEITAKYLRLLFGPPSHK